MDIWVEGYAATGDRSGASYICSVNAPTFREACIKAHNMGLFNGYGNFNKDI